MVCEYVLSFILAPPSSRICTPVSVSFKAAQYSAYFPQRFFAMIFTPFSNNIDNIALFLEHVNAGLFSPINVRTIFQQ